MRLRLTSVSIALLFFLTACSGGGDPAAPSANLSESGESHTLRDDLRLLGNVNEVAPAGENRLVISDNSPGVALFEDYEMVRSYGSEGEGPCEYTSVNSFDISGDTLFVLNTSQAKIITYRISSGECLGERNPSLLSSQYYLERENGYFHTARISYHMMSPDSTRLLFKLRDSGESEAYPLTLGDLNPVQSPIQARAPGLDFARHGNRLYAYFPLTDMLTVLNTGDGSISGIPLRVDLKREEIEEAGEDLNAAVEIIQNQMEWVYPVLSSEEWIAVGVLRNNDDDPVRRVQFYSHEGAFLGESVVEGRAVAVDGNRLVLLREASDPSGDYTYELAYREVTLQ